MAISARTCADRYVRRRDRTRTTARRAQDLLGPYGAAPTQAICTRACHSRVRSSRMHDSRARRGGLAGSLVSVRRCGVARGCSGAGRADVRFARAAAARRSGGAATCGGDAMCASACGYKRIGKGRGACAAARRPYFSAGSPCRTPLCSGVEPSG